MGESAYVDPPWLIDRDGVGYLQVSPLLYRIAERADGSSSPADIARAITEAGESVQAQTVERLLAGMLVPAGVIVGADGKAVKPEARPRSPLSLAGRMKMLGPGAIEPLTGFLKLLFWPPIVIPVVAASIAARIWLYFFHGVAGPAHDALYRPVLLLLLFGLVVAAAGFHEFGHAAALRYGGGRVRGMGVGLYLIYPAVYTDVTENYRLGRWARVRTDLGGFYFNLLFALAVLAVALLTGQQFLLVFLLLTDIEILQQALPFARFDGYWVLADLTGITDFFTHMGQFWRRVLRLPRTPDAQLPKLKAWGKAVLAVYSVVTVPVLLILLALTVTALPRVLATAWDSGQHQLAAAATAWAHQDFIGAVAAGLQILILAFPALAVVYLLARTFKQVESRLWTWAGDSNPKRALAGLTTLAILAACGWAWAPALPRGGRGPAVENLTPIAPSERGTAGDLAGGAAASVGPSAASVTGGSTVNPAPSPSSGTAQPSPSAVPSAGSSPLPSASPSP